MGKIWSSDCIGNRGYKTLPQRQKGIIQVAIIILLPLLLPCSIILALPGCVIVMLDNAKDITFFRYTVRDSGLFFNVLWFTGLGLLTVAIAYPLAVLAILLGSLAFLVITPFDIIIDITVWIVRQL